MYSQTNVEDKEHETIFEIGVLKILHFVVSFCGSQQA
jgi:hypothetical protein